MTVVESPQGLGEVISADILAKLEARDKSAIAARERFRQGQLIGDATRDEQIPERLAEVADGLRIFGYKIVAESVQE